MFKPFLSLRSAAAIFFTSALTGCVVSIEVAGSTATPVAFPARLYPANDLASRYGMVNATVTNDLQGRGVFNAVINGEAFVGEATRKSGSGRAGVASGAGNRGSFLSCEYTLNTATQGTGQCKLSDGAVFNMHLGN